MQLPMLYSLKVAPRKMLPEWFWSLLLIIPGGEVSLTPSQGWEQRGASHEKFHAAPSKKQRGVLRRFHPFRFTPRKKLQNSEGGASPPPPEFLPHQEKDPFNKGQCRPYKGPKRPCEEQFWGKMRVVKRPGVHVFCLLEWLWRISLVIHHLEPPPTHISHAPCLMRSVLPCPNAEKRWNFSNDMTSLSSKQALWASRDVMPARQTCSQKLQRVSLKTLTSLN